MKVTIEIDPSLASDEVLIRCRKMDEHILQLQQTIADAEPEKSCMSLQDGDTSYYVPLGEILFFETSSIFSWVYSLPPSSRMDRSSSVVMASVPQPKETSWTTCMSGWVQT